MIINAEVHDIKIRTWASGLNSNPTVKLMAHTALAKELNPYIPMRTGTLSQSTEITAEHLRYTQPYAHYQYTGIVYGPNRPITENGVIVGWFSTPGQPKHPTGALLQYSGELHPLATHHWDKAMMRDRKKEFTAEIARIIKWVLDKEKK